MAEKPEQISPYTNLTQTERELIASQAGRTQARIREKQGAKEATAQGEEELLAQEEAFALQAELRARNAQFLAARQQAIEEETAEGGAPQKKKTIFGLAFWLILCVCILKDAVDVLCALLEAAGVGLSATVVGSVAGIPIAGVAFILDLINSLITNMILFAYFYLRGDRSASKLITRGLSMLVDMIPGLDILPMTTAMFVIVHLAERFSPESLNVLSAASGKGGALTKLAGNVV